MEKKKLEEKLRGLVIFTEGDGQGQATNTTLEEELGEHAMQKVLDLFSQELGRAREEGEIEVLKDMQKVWDNDNLGDAPKYGSAGAGLMKRWIRDDINERLSKLTTR